MTYAGLPAVPTEHQDALLEWVAAGGTVLEYCEEHPELERNKVYRLIVHDADFANRYARAREAQLVAWEDEIKVIADDGTNDYVERQGRKGTFIALDDEHVNRSRLRVDTRKWIMARASPKKYGDKVSHVGGGPEDDPIRMEHSASPRETLEKRLEAMGKKSR
jgi:hypothetical protein